MVKIFIFTLLIGLGITFGALTNVAAQEEATPQPPSEEQQLKEKEAQNKRAFTLLDQTIEEAQFLKLPENRIRIQINAADLLWERNEGRARSLFSLAADGVAEMMHNSDATAANERQNFSLRTPAQLRQELVLTVARHDATLAYQFLAATRPLAPPTPQTDARNFRRPSADDNLEQRLLAQVAGLDPKLALQNAEQSLEKGQYPRSLGSVLAQLQEKDKEGAAKLEDKMLKRLQSANMLASVDAGSLALSLLQPGPRPESSANSATIVKTSPDQVLALSGYRDLMGTVIDAALKATPQAANNQRGQNNFRGRGNNLGGGPDTAATPPTDAQIEQNSARRLLFGLQAVLPQIDQYLPDRAQNVRQKMTELNMNGNPRGSFNQALNLMQQGTADSLMAAAPSAPPVLQTRIYQQAALKALDEGNADRARQIANDHLDASTRDVVLQTVEFRLTSEKADASKIDEVRQTLSRLRSDDERINLLLQLSGATRQNNPKLALQLLDEARQFTNRRPSNYQLFEAQLKVADAFKDLDPSRSFEVLEPGIAQLNELLSAAATLSGFEVSIFKDGELPLEAGSALSSIVMRYGQEIAALAKLDFERAQTLTNRFQLAEPRILTRLSMVRTLLGAQPAVTSDNGPGLRGFGQNFNFPRPPQ